MAGPSSPDSKQKDLDQLIRPQMRYEERITFETPAKEGMGGVVKSLDLNGCILASMERVRLQTEIVLHLTLVMGVQKMECDIAAKVADFDASVPLPLKGYKISFNPTNSEVVKQAIRNVVQPISKPATVLARKEPPPPPAPRPAAETQPIPEPFAPAPIPVTSMNASRPLLYIFLGVSVLLVAGYFGYFFFAASKLSEHIPKSIPVSATHQVDRDLFVEVSSKWLEETPQPTKEQILIPMAKELAKQGIFSTHILDPQKREWANIMIAVGDKTFTPSIRWH